ncbi:transposase [Rugosimonospora africana]|uniref:Transposase n=1 Tax=Rugosimonospora africana TaxID=556532 RepID=A0A8J3VN63_9ACTN|nr:transposase [Rugosimonospora africana]GIH12625.1 hypothetical protein Raf01_07970 [Rugosimonospora africana]
MALVRVYCGLASTPPAATQDSADALLTVAVVDDAGRLLDVCEVRDDPTGYAELGALLAERSGGTAGLAVAADSDEHQVTLLLAAAGRPLAISDEESLDDYANRFGDDDSTDELEAPVSERRAVGLARALQAGALVAGTVSAPRELIALKPILSAHAALTSGRQGAAVALREVLRELYPAALRAYPDPAEPIPLAILDALPEPGLLGAGAANRGRDAQVAAQLSSSGLADETAISDSITALRVAIAETPRRAGIGKTLTTAVAETIRQSVAAVRACDTGIAALVGLLTEKAAPITGGLPARSASPSTPLRAVRESSSELPRVQRRGRSQQPAPVSVDAVTVDPLRVGSGARPAVTRSTIPRREDFAASPAAHAAPPSPSHTPPSHAAPTPTPQPRGGQSRTPSPMAPPPAAPLPVTPPPMAPAASHGTPSPISHNAPSPASHAVPEQVNPPVGRPSSPPPVPMSGPPSYSTPSVVSAPPSRGTPTPGDPYPSGAYGYPQSRAAAAPSAENAIIPVPAPRPAPEVGPPGSRSDWPLNTSGTGLPTVGSDRPDPARLARRDEPGQSSIGQPTPNPLDPTSFPATTLPPTVLERRGGEPVAERRPAIPRQRDGRVTPPWQDNDLPAEPPALRLVEPAPLADRALRDDRPGMRERDRDREILGSGERTGGDRPGGASTGEFSTQGRSGGERTFSSTGEFSTQGRNGGDRTLGAAAAFSGERRLGAAAAFNRDSSGEGTNGAPLRLVENDDARGGRTRRPAEPISAPPVSDEPDGDLLIFAQARSAWFTGHLEVEETAPDWANSADLGWQAAQRAAEPVRGEETEVGLPRRVPQANLVPGSPLPPPASDRALHIVRDPAAMAAHTTGYFRGSRRGEEVRGFAVGGRPGREAAGGWDFTRDGWEAEQDEDRDFNYRSASNR